MFLPRESTFREMLKLWRSEIIENKVRFVENCQGNLYPELFFHGRNNNNIINCHHNNNTIQDKDFSRSSINGNNYNDSRNRNDNTSVIV